MRYIMLLWPHANVRYQTEAARLAVAELKIMLGRLQPDAVCGIHDDFCMPALRISVDTPLSADTIRRISSHSLMYGLLQETDHGLIPLAGRAEAAVGEDLPGILKYKGKTNEMFTAMMLNLAVYSGSYYAADERLRILDPMCGKGTALFVAANCGYDCDGSDLDKNELAESERFFKKYLEYHKIKHKMHRESLTLGNGASPCTCFRYDVNGESLGFRLALMDAKDVRRGFGKNAYHAIICDLPYGVQHAPHGGGLNDVLERSLPQWYAALKPGAACGISFNAAILKRTLLTDMMEKAGFTVMRSDVYDNMEHWVEQAVTRDIVVGTRP